MDNTFIEEMKELLYKERKEILDRMNGDNSSFKEEGATGRGDSVDLASDEGAFKKMEALNAMDAKRLTAVENALKRISENKYGIGASQGNAVRSALHRLQECRGKKTYKLLIKLGKEGITLPFFFNGGYHPVSGKDLHAAVPDN